MSQLRVAPVDAFWFLCHVHIKAMLLPILLTAPGQELSVAGIPGKVGCRAYPGGDFALRTPCQLG